MDQPIAEVELQQNTDLRKLMSDQISRCQPMVIRGALAHWPAAAKWDPAAGGFSRLEALAGDADVQVMVAPLGAAFYGDVRSKRMVGATFKEFLEMAQAATGLSEDARGEQLYLAQAPILDAEQAHPQPLAPLLEDMCMPSFLDDEKVTNVNLWVSVNGSKSSTHYDPYQNLLCVVAGEKTVSLWDPTATPGLYPMALHGEAFNHSAVNFAAPDHARYPRYREVFQTCRTVRVGAGDALFIPEGWWHQVDSSGTTIGVNIWWQSRFSAMLGAHMDAYYARQAIASLLFTEKKRRLASILPYRTTNLVPATPAPIGGTHPRVPPDNPNPRPPLSDSSAHVSPGDMRKVSPAPPSKATKGRRKRATQKAAAAAVNHRSADGSSGEQQTSDCAARRLQRSLISVELETVDRVVQEAAAASFDAQVRTAPSAEQTDAGVPSATPASRSLSMPSIEDTPTGSGSEVGRLSDAQQCGASPSKTLEKDDTKRERAEPRVSASAREAESAAARKRRHVVECLSTREAQLLQALVLHAGGNNKSGSDSGPNRFERPQSNEANRCQHCGRGQASGAGEVNKRAYDRLGNGAVGCELDNGSEAGTGGRSQKTDVVAGVFATSEPSMLQRVLLAMATAFPRALERLILYGLSPAAAELLTTCFEEFDKVNVPGEPRGEEDPMRVVSTAAFFERFYAVFEDRGAAMGALLDGKEAFAAQALRDVLTDLQGVSDVSAQSGMTKEPVE